MKYVSKSLDETQKIAQELIENLEQNDNIILLQGDLGAGKTTFSQGVLEYLGAEGPFTSPTFVIMKDYAINFSNQKGARFEKIYHLDCYRIDSAGLLDLGWVDIIKNKKNLILLEWPEKILEALPEEYLKIDFKVLGENEREIDINHKQ